MRLTTSLRSGAHAAAVAAAVMAGAAAFTPSEASAHTRCVAKAFTIRGYEIPRTRAASAAAGKRTACRAAIDACEFKLDRRRHVTGRPMPYAQCEVIRTRYLH